MSGPLLPSRRTVLAWGVGALLLGGCTDAEEPAPDPPPPLTPDEIVAAEVLASKREILAEYAATSAALPSLAAALAPFVAAHEAHLLAVGDSAREIPSPSSSPSPSTAVVSPSGAAGSPGASGGSRASGASGASGTAATGPPPPADPAAALVALASLDLAAAAERIKQVGRASGPFARLLASVGAAEAVHAALLPALAAG